MSLRRTTGFSGAIKLIGSTMKKTLALAVAALFLIIPFGSFSQTIISDSDLSKLTGQVALGDLYYVNSLGSNVTVINSVHVNFDNFYIDHQNLKPTSAGGYGGFDGYADNVTSYVGTSNITVTGGTVIRSGSMDISIASVAPKEYGTVAGDAVLIVSMDSLKIEGNQTVDMTFKLGTNSDLSGSQEALGSYYMGGMSYIMNAKELVIYAHH